MIPMYYGGIDRIHGDISIESADKVLDLIDDYVELVEALYAQRSEHEIVTKEG